MRRFSNKTAKIRQPKNLQIITILGVFFPFYIKSFDKIFIKSNHALNIALNKLVFFVCLFRICHFRECSHRSSDFNAFHFRFKSSNGFMVLY